MPLSASATAPTNAWEKGTGRADERIIEEKARELRSQLFGWFRTYVDPDKDGALEPVAGRGQLCKVGPEANGRNPFHRAVAVEYHR